MITDQCALLIDIIICDVGDCQCLSCDSSLNGEGIVEVLKALLNRNKNSGRNVQLLNIMWIQHGKTKYLS